METFKMTFRTDRPDQESVDQANDPNEEPIQYLQANSKVQGVITIRELNRANGVLQDSAAEIFSTMATTEDHSRTLPNELLLQVFRYLADFTANPPSAYKFSLEPSMELTRNEDQPLKTLSLVCQRWRNILLPDVFRHMCVTLSPRPRWLCLCTSLERQIKGRRGRSRHADDILKTINARLDMSPERASISKYPENPMGLEYVEDDEPDLLSLPGEFLHWLPSVRGDIGNFLEFIVEKQLQSEVKSLVLQAHQELTPNLTGIEESIIVREVNLLWKTFFRTVNPPRLVIVAPSSTMAALTSSREGSADTWAFEMPLHYLSFSVQGSDNKDASTSRSSSIDSTTIIDSQKISKRRSQLGPQNMQPWTHMSYNEGTMLPGYAHYEWQWKTPPQVLPYLLYSMRRQQKCARSPNLRSFSYVSIFPYAGHIERVMEELSHSKSIRVLKVKFAEPDYLDDSARLGKGQTGDVWTEWSNSYGEVVDHFLREVGEGVVFESEDAERAGLRKGVSKILGEKGKLRNGPVLGPSFLRSEVGKEILGGDGEAMGRIKWVRTADPKGWGRNV